MNTTLLSGEKATQEDVERAKARLPRSSSSLKLEAYHIYSPEEHIVGEWQEMVDGVLKKKPVYEKTVEFTTKSSAGWNSFNHGISDVDFIFIDNAYVKTSIYNFTTGYATGNNPVMFDVSKDIVEVYASETGLLNKPAVTFLRYTKTTDKWQIV